MVTALDDFKAELNRPDLIADLRAGLIGDDAVIEGPFGPRPLVYADYVASGRALRQVETFVMERVLPFYANTHTEASFCGSHTSRLRNAARAEIARIVGAGAGHSVVFTGAGSTAAINRIVGLLDVAPLVAQGARVVVLVGPYEHHSNLLPWRESGAEVIEIAEAETGGPDMEVLRATLEQAQGAALIVGAFSAASNVTGIVTDTDAVTRMLKAHGALAIWDFGGGGPYLPMAMNAGTDCAKDAIVWSSHKFPGGPGGSGVLAIRDAIARRTTPTLPGGGTVSFVSPWDHTYSTRLTAREEGGTPNVVGDIRAALVMLIKEAIGDAWLARRQDALRARALKVWGAHPRLQLMGLPGAKALPIFSFRVRDGQGGFVHHQQFTRMLSDVHGIQARGGCACAGSYAHRLLDLDLARSNAITESLRAGNELDKPGWVRLNLSALMSDEKADFVIRSVAALADAAPGLCARYTADPATARFDAGLPTSQDAPQPPDALSA